MTPLALPPIPYDALESALKVGPEWDQKIFFIKEIIYIGVGRRILRKFVGRAARGILEFMADPCDYNLGLQSYDILSAGFIRAICG